MKLPFLNQTSERELRKPAPASIPKLESLQVAAQYKGARMGGDFFEFIAVGPSRLVFVIMDIAGKRDEAMHIAAAVQEKFRKAAIEMFSAEEVNEAEAASDLNILLNRTVLEAAGGVRCAPAFLGSFDENLGTLTYVNSGHTSALVREAGGTTELKATGVPLGLFSHAVTDAQLWVLQPGSTLLLASKGLIESKKAFQKEYGFKRLVSVVKEAQFATPAELCMQVLGDVEKYTHNADPENDVTTVALMRTAAVQSAMASAGSSR
ncbi:MAG: PP2C family protein-serine/threonine phosphatase [Terriglobales bacterium]|jgi:serine phosphatase RsbU (regulator of sigma subunit)